MKKNFKRFLSTMLAIVILLSTATTSYAGPTDQSTPGTGTTSDTGELKDVIEDPSGATPGGYVRVIFSPTKEGYIIGIGDIGAEKVYDVKDTLTWGQAKEAGMKIPVAKYKNSDKSFNEWIKIPADDMTVKPTPEIVTQGGKYLPDYKDVDASLYTPVAEKEIVSLGEKYDLTDNVTIPGFPQYGTQPIFEDVTPKGDIDVNKIGFYKGKVKVIYPNGSTEVVDVPVEVVDNEYNPIVGGGILPDPISVDNNTVTTTPVEDLQLHKAYIKGYPDGSVRPDGQITRAEAAAMVARLQGLDLSDNSKPNFSDVESGWYNKYLNAVVAKDMLLAEDGKLRPNEPITRAEFARLIASIDKDGTIKVAPFEDAKGHKFEAAINKAFTNGRIDGYPDGTFRPDGAITRAEATKIVNSLFDRMVTAKGLLTIQSGTIKTFTDLNVSHWGYYELVEASNTHMYKRVNNTTIEELWIRVLDSVVE